MFVTECQTDSQTDGWTDRWTVRQLDKQMGKQDTIVRRRTDDPSLPASFSGAKYVH